VAKPATRQVMIGPDINREKSVVNKIFFGATPLFG